MSLLNPLGMNWQESLLQKAIYFLLISVLVVANITLFPFFDEADTKGRILNMFLQFFILYIATIWFSKIFSTVGRRIR